VKLPNLVTRVLFAVVAIPIVLWAVWQGGTPLVLLLATASALASWEFARLARGAGHQPFVIVIVIVAFLLPIAARGVIEGTFTPPVFALGIVIVLGVLAAALFFRRPDQRPVGAAATTVLAVLYPAGSLSFAYALRYHNYVIGAAGGTALLMFPMVVAWATDTAAFFVGKAFGRRKLMPAVSPNKTVAGAVGGLIFAVLVSLFYVRYALIPYASLTMTMPMTMTVALLVSASAQIGDLVESQFKREAGVKDSSHLIPGHGGVLDRLDSLFFTIPVTYFLLTFPHVLIPVFR
jgi:phosphatidate cytidylyltransferase